MKKLIFIDNDREERSLEDVDYVKNVLEYAPGLPNGYVDTMEIISDFAHMDRDLAYKMIFDPSNCVCTWSMFTATHYGSLYQMVRFLENASIGKFENLVYIDASGMFPRSIERFIKDSDKACAVLNAIETNFIISQKEGRLFRVRADFKGYYESYFKEEKVNLKKLLS